MADEKLSESKELRITDTVGQNDNVVLFRKEI